VRQYAILDNQGRDWRARQHPEHCVVSHTKAADDIEFRGGLIEQFRLTCGVTHDLGAARLDLLQTESALLDSGYFAADRNHFEMLREYPLDHLGFLGQANTERQSDFPATEFLGEEEGLLKSRGLAVMPCFNGRSLAVQVGNARVPVELPMIFRRLETVLALGASL